MTKSAQRILRPVLRPTLLVRHHDARISLTHALAIRLIPDVFARRNKLLALLLANLGTVSHLAGIWRRRAIRIDWTWSNGGASSKAQHSGKYELHGILQL